MHYVIGFIFQEQDQSYECLNKHGFDHKKCEAYFDNYNTCKKFWVCLIIFRKV